MIKFPKLFVVLVGLFVLVLQLLLELEYVHFVVLLGRDALLKELEYVEGHC